MQHTGMPSAASKLPVVLGLVFVAVLLLAVYLTGSRRRAARARSAGLGNLGWALLFLTSGRMPPPPLEAQIEAELNTKKDRLATDPVRKPSDQS